ncbi:MAG: S41 family peptidase [Emticicia sp.]|nr:S41 family peptidase [Emticicia sp.]
MRKEIKKSDTWFTPSFWRTYDEQLKQVFGQFKAAGVNEMVLDLRTNGGGRISSADLISSLVVKNLNTNNVIHQDEWNATIKAKFPSVATPTKFTSQANNLNLNRLFVLTSNGTASASELVINSLRPYMDVIIVGQNTAGKNVGSITIKDEATPIRWKWGMQPIVLRTVNSKGESAYGTKTGFTPDHIVSDNIYPFKPWGDESETLLKKTLEVITGIVVPAEASASANRSYRTINKSAILEEHISDNPADNRKDMFTTLPVK